jgi:hypothetical protein
MQARGSGATFAIFQDETTYGTAPGSPAGAKLYLRSFGVQAQQGQESSQVITGNRARPKPYLTNRNIQGQLTGEINAENLGFLLRHALGVVSTTGTGPYQHAINIGALPESFTLEVDYGSAISGSGRYIQYSGCRVNQATFSFPQAGACTFSMDVVGAQETPASSPLDATLTDTGHTTFDAFSATIEEGGSAVADIKSVEITLNNNLDTDGFVLGGGGVRGALPEGFAVVTGRLTALFDSATLMNKTLNQTESILFIGLSRGSGSGAAGNEAIQFHVPKLVYDRHTPPVPGPAGILAELSFTAFKDTDVPFYVTLNNALPSLVPA